MTTAAPETGDAITLHATCLLVGEAGLLLRGASGSGKSTLARDLLDARAGTGDFARLVADDRVRLTRVHERIVAAAIPATAGLLEIRGLGLVRVPWEPKAVLRLVVDCDVAPARMPEDTDLTADLLGIRLPRLNIGGIRDRVSLVRWRLRGLCDTPMTVG